MKYICCQPSTDYYAWQVEVLINNFIEKGVNPNDIEIVCSHKGEIPELWSKLSKAYNSVRFFFYKDTRFKTSYVSSIRPFILHKHWMLHPELSKETIFYHDCDIILAKPMDFSSMLQDDNCYVSDTISYIGAKYIRSKGEHYLNIMTSLVGIDKELVIAQEENSGGAQYLLKNIPAEFWSKVYYDSDNLFRIITNQIAADKSREAVPNDDPYNPLQIWCADMWAVLWNLWYFNKEVRVTKDLSFSWATDDIENFDNHNIYHNAGVTYDRAQELFYKGVYQTELPYHINPEIYSKKYCSYKYVEAILKTKQVSCLIKQEILE